MNQHGQLEFLLLWRHQCFDLKKLDNDSVQKALLKLNHLPRSG
jgi:hypothetical protein